MNESHRLILSDGPSLHVPLPRHPRVSRRARSGGMSRIALISACRQADDDKTRVSSIYKRRVTPVPEEAAASTEASCCWARPSGLERGWMAPLEVWTRKVAGSGCATLPSSSSRRDSGAPDARVGAVSRGCRRCDVDCHPVASSSRFRWSADHRNSPRSRSRWPASQRTSPGSEPSVVEICRLIAGRDRAGASTAPAGP